MSSATENSTCSGQLQHVIFAFRAFFFLYCSSSCEELGDIHFADTSAHALHSYLIDCSNTEDKRLYTPPFLIAGKLDEAMDIIEECAGLTEKINQDKKKVWGGAKLSGLTCPLAHSWLISSFACVIDEGEATAAY